MSRSSEKILPLTDKRRIITAVASRLSLLRKVVEFFCHDKSITLSALKIFCSWWNKFFWVIERTTGWTASNRFNRKIGQLEQSVKITSRERCDVILPACFINRHLIYRSRFLFVYLKKVYIRPIIGVIKVNSAKLTLRRYCVFGQKEIKGKRWSDWCYTHLHPIL